MTPPHGRPCLNRIAANRARSFIPAAVLAAAVLLVLVPQTRAAQTAVVVTDRLNVRPVPGMHQAPIAMLYRGDRVRVIKEFDGWLEVAFGHRSGFVRNRERYIRILPSTDIGSPGRDLDPDIAREKAEVIAEEIEKGEKALKQVTRQEKTVVAKLDEINHRLNRARRRTAALDRELSDLEEKIAEGRAAADRLAAEIDRLEGYAAGRLVAYYKLQWIGSAHVLASADSLAEMIQRKAALERIIAADEALWSQWTSRRRQERETLKTLEHRKERKLAVEAELTEQIATMNREKERRAELLARIRQEKTLQLASIESLKDAATELERILEGLRRQSPEQEEEAEPAFTDFRTLRGLLPMPVSGKIVARFGKYRNTRYNVDNFRSGIDIRADRGEPIHAVSGGRVMFAEWFKGYGNMIIVDHGSFYYTVYAHAEELFKQKGDIVESGEVIATVGDTGSMAGPGLYFEIRYHGKPLDPSDWLSAG
jgi:septal ring factor EnvC (AmiA/AmiB activator)